MFYFINISFLIYFYNILFFKINNYFYFIILLFINLNIFYFYDRLINKIFIIIYKFLFYF